MEMVVPIIYIERAPKCYIMRPHVELIKESNV